MAIVKQGIHRDQLFYTTLDNLIDEDTKLELLVIDFLVDKIDFKSLGYEDKSNNRGTSSYSFESMFKLFVLGKQLKIRSGRDLEDACKHNLKFIWLLNALNPKHTCINEFRRKHAEIIKKAFYEFNRLYIKAGLMEIGDESTDGFKLKASNNKDLNYTINKINDRINRDDIKIKDFEKIITEKEKDVSEYLEALNTAEEIENLEETKINLENKIKDIEKTYEDLITVDERYEKHNNIYNHMINNGLSQLSNTDPDSRLMPNNGKFDVCFNVQSLVNMDSHLITAFNVTNQPNDHGSLTPIANILNNEYNDISSVTNTTDKGYNSTTDMVGSLENGVIPQVTPMNKDEEFVILETEHEENNITEDELNSTKPEDIKKCLRAGKIPTCYKDSLENIEIVDKLIDEDDKTNICENRRPDEIREEALIHSTFERDINTNIVYCPQGQALAQKSTSNGKCKYANKLACKHCKNPCTNAKFKEVCFSKNQKTVIPKNCTSKANKKGKKKKTKTTVVQFKLKLDKELLKKRMQTSEHTQGTMKTAHNHGYLTVRGFRMVEADLAFYFISVNIKRLIKKYGAKEILKKLQYIDNNDQKKDENNKKIKIFSKFKISLFFLPFFQKFNFFSRQISLTFWVNLPRKFTKTRHVNAVSILIYIFFEYFL